MDGYIRTLEDEFRLNANAIVAKGQKAYMKENFEFFGIKTPLRRKLQQPFLMKANLPPKEKLPELVEILWNKPERDFQLFAQELAYKYIKNLEPQDIDLFEYMVRNKSWWDTVDFIAVKLMGAYFLQYPEARKKYVDKWLASDHLWLQRSTLLFQLNYKKNLDTNLLVHTINSLLGSKEFFINKAIGWILRQYSKTAPDWVMDFVKRTSLANLSKKEALRLIKN
ncbi:DNA alkylation repair protein [Echinicola shivajiensis]|uniref:DNA alkylation repair protein n=1 Tax=Echinicola shivajiensis TaxID=1035916 RepID=UPI001BFC1243|nr:DNA alkylation repair protein [Echinicola shivajiensis]